MQVHGITPEILLDKPKFADIAKELLEFIKGAELIIHNAPFDVGFLNMELRLLDMAPLPAWCGGVTDTLAMAKALHPGQRNNLDALCKRYGVDNAARTLHGALLDCELLAAVYLAMTRGQESLSIGLEARSAEASQAAARTRPRPVLLQASADELAAHASLLEAIAQGKQGGLPVEVERRGRFDRWLAQPDWTPRIVCWDWVLPVWPWCRRRLPQHGWRWC